MKIYYSTKFEREYRKLPKEVKFTAEKKEKLFREDPYSIQLKIHRLTGKLKGYWSFSINYSYRIIFEFAGEKIVWFHSIGTHAIYD